MGTALIAIGAIVPMLLILVVIHELGHFATARLMGVKVLEFGVGFPPRALGWYTGRTRVLLDLDTRFIGIGGAAELSSGQLVKVSSSEDVHGNLVARTVELVSPSRFFQRGRKDGGRKDDGPADRPDPTPNDYLNHDGKIREVDGGSFIVADMLYSVNWAPLGGFVRLAGESNPNVPRSLAGKGAGTRMLVLAAGSFMNAILPLVIFTVMFMVPQQVMVGQVQISQVSQDSPAQAAGLRPGDIVLRANGDSLESVPDLTRMVNLNGSSPMEWVVLRNGRQEVSRVIPRFGVPEGRWLVGILIKEEAGRVLITRVGSGSPAEAAGIQDGDVIVRAGGSAISSIDELTSAIGQNQGSEMELVVDRAGRQQAVQVTPVFEQSEAQQWLTGVTPVLINHREESRSQPIWTAAYDSVVSTWELLVLVKQGFQGAVSSGSAPQVAGPVGIAKVAGDFTREDGINGWLIITIILSVNLAIVNMLPIPMLDGGRFVFVVLEWVRRGRRVPPEKEGLVHLIGFIVLMAGIVVITANDIRHLLPG